MLVLLACVTVARATDSPADAIVGVWLTEQGEGKIRIFRCGERYCGKTVWIRPTAEWPDPATKTDTLNPSPDKRSRKLIGATMMWGLTYDAEDGVYEDGSIYDSTRGKVYPCKAWVVEGGRKLKLRGFIGISLLGQNTYWSRVK
ncbi:MAG: DUF2147 domain-containing protein [Deltaproteobacteria bacterium]|nr:DUF2147 domain-containing protein [Deltaproteobacteria bacterium]MBW2533438.1 DUF2147 domain-containing protein [Deltaproteobacteria bacterium]